MPRRRQASPASEADPAVLEEIRESRRKFRDHMYENLVAAALAYHAELSRTDNAHRARMNSRWADLTDAVLAAADAHRGLSEPITREDIEWHLRTKRFAASLCSGRSRRARKYGE